jgi:hypothetical protein
MAISKQRIREIVSLELESGTDALVDEEREELAATIAEKLAAEDNDVYDDASELDGDAAERNPDDSND